MDQQIIVSCLGRPMELGMLYDCRSESPIPGVTLWGHKKLIENSDIHQCESSQYEITADDSIDKKVNSMGIEASVKLSFLGGMLKVDGAAKYLDSHRNSANQARIILKYTCKSYFEQLTMDQLGLENIEYPAVFHNDSATHVVTAIEYGADAFFVFDRQLHIGEKSCEIEGNLKASLSKISAMGVGQLTNDEKNLANSFKCTFYGDVVLKENPTTFEDAIIVYKNLPCLIRQTKGHSDIYGIPKKAYLYPLCKLDSRAAKLVHEISNNALSQTQSMLEDIQSILIAANDLESSQICQKLSSVKQQISKFKFLVTQFRLSFQRKLCELLPKIRGGGLEEIKLFKLLEQIQNSPFNASMLGKWLDIKKREISCLKCYLQDLDTFPFAFQPGELERFTQDSSLKYILCISLGNITGSDHPFLETLKEFLMDKIDEIQEWDQETDYEETWCDDENITMNLQKQLHVFRDFAISNKAKHDLKCIVVSAGKKGKMENPGSISLYTQGHKQLFQPPSAPGQPKMKSNAENEITINWNVPEIGSKSVESYNVFYRPIDALDSNFLQVNTSMQQITVTKLSPETEYAFKVAAVTIAGESPLSEESLLYTMPPPPLALSILPNCSRIATFKNGQPDWYQLPMRVTDINPEMGLRRADIGEPCSDTCPHPWRVVLLVGATGCGKSTLINGLINYLYGVKWEDNFRLQLIPKESTQSQAHSQTSCVTSYVIHWQPKSRVPYNVIFIDTPGYGDTRGIEQDANLIKQVQLFFDTSIDQIDAVGFVIQSAMVRLTESQKYIFDGILSLFGKDIEDNVFLMLTFADGSNPQVMAAVDEFEMPRRSVFKFNNSVFTLDAPGDNAQLCATSKSLNTGFWKLAYAAYENFFDELKAVKPKSLTLTREVLQERRHLECTIDALTLKINDGVNQLLEMQNELPIIMEYDAQKAANQAYTRTIEVPQKRHVKYKIDPLATAAKVVYLPIFAPIMVGANLLFDKHICCDAMPGRGDTSCTVCETTCHKGCGLIDEAKRLCVAMDKYGNCKVCRGRCNWKQHQSLGFYYEDYTGTKEVTINDMKKKYDEANANLSIKENLLLGIFKKYNQVQKDVLEGVEEIRRYLERLDVIAMRPNPLSAVQYIDVLIKANNRDKRPGWEQRLLQLENARKRAVTIQEMKNKGQNYDPFAKMEEDIKKAAHGKKGCTEMIKKVFGWDESKGHFRF